MIRIVRPGLPRLPVLLLAVVLATSACAGTMKKQGSAANAKILPPASIAGSITTRPSATVADQGAYAVGLLERTYVDTSRKTHRNGTAAAKPERTLPTIILYPARGPGGYETSTLDAKAAAGPWPLIVFSHGVTGTGRDYSTTLRVIASAGYVVVAPDYPLSKRTAEGGPSVGDVPEQTRDVAFLIDRVLAATKSTGGPLAGLIDPARIGLAGHSLGAITSLGAGFNACCSDPRVKAVAEWAGIFLPLESKGKVAPNAKGRPLLIVHGDKDGTVNYRFGPQVYAKLGPPKYFITLPGAGHVLPYVQGVGNPQSTAVTLATIDFFDRYLKGDKAGIDRLHDVVEAAGPAAADEQEQVG